MLSSHKVEGVYATVCFYLRSNYFNAKRFILICDLNFVMVFITAFACDLMLRDDFISLFIRLNCWSKTVGNCSVLVF